MPFSCCVRNCPGKNEKQIFHLFPRDLELLKVWCKNIDRESLLSKDPAAIRKGYRVCDVHFSEEDKFPACRNRTNLKFGSVPTINLPGPNLEHITQQYQKDTSSTPDNTLTVKPLQIDDPVPNSSLDSVNLISDVQTTHFKSLTSLLLGDCNDDREICRICLRRLNVEEIKKFSKRPEKNLQIANMLQLVLPDLDQNMCSNNKYCSRCLALLMYSYELKETWLMAEEKLQKIIKDKNKRLTEKPTDSLAPQAEVLNFETWNEEVANISRSVNFVRRMPVKRRSLNLGPGPYQCEECGLVYMHPQKFAKHTMKHRNSAIQKEKPMCEICGKQFSYKGFKYHKESHTRNQDSLPEIYECPRCKKIFYKKTSLMNHISSIHKGGLGHFQCHICGKKVTSRTSFRQHMVRHTGVKPYQCKVCEKRFFFKNRLRKHELTHSGEKFSCEYCGKTMNLEYSLKTHIRIFHMGGGKHVCETCERPFAHKEGLDSHRIRIHGWTAYKQKVSLDEGSLRGDEKSLG